MGSVGFEFGTTEFGAGEFGETPSSGGGGGGSTAKMLVVRTIEGEDFAERLANGRWEAELTENGYSSDIYLMYLEAETGDVPTRGQRFRITLPSGLVLILRAKSIPEVDKEVVGAGGEIIYVYKFTTVDPLTFLQNEKPPDVCPFVNSSTGEIIRTLLALYDNTLDLSGIADGNPVAGFNSREFSTFGDILRSEIAAGGYVLRMGNGNLVEGGFSLPANSDYRVDYTDYRYTPSRQQIKPPDEILGSVTVIPTSLVPAYVTNEVAELDLRGLPAYNLNGKPLGLENAEPLKLSGQTDLSDTKAYEVSGGISSAGTYLVFTGGRVTVREARPYAFPFMTVWSGIIIQSEGGSFSFGFVSGCGDDVIEMLVVTSNDFTAAGIPLIADAPLDKHRYAAYAISNNDGTVAVWGLHIHEDFTVDEDQVIAQVLSIDSEHQRIVLTAPWDVGSSYIRVLHAGEEIGRSYIRRVDETGTILDLEAVPPDTREGDDVTRGVQDNVTTTIRLLKTVSVGGGYGLPSLTGNGVALEQMLIQRTGQITGKLLYQSNANPNSDYPRDLVLDVDVTEFSDAQIAGSGSSAVVTWTTKFTHEQQAWMSFRYVVGARREFDHVCDPNGVHTNLSIDGEIDPAVLEQAAIDICTLGSQAYPRVTANIESSEVVGTPFPGDMLPVNLPSGYQIAEQDIPVTSVKLQYKGARIESEPQEDLDHGNEDILLYTIQAGPKLPVDRVKEQLLRHLGITKYPIRTATIGGTAITAFNWDDLADLMTASVSGGGAVYGPHGDVLDLAGGISPAAVAGVLRPAVAPVTLRCTVEVAGRTYPDILVFTVVYRPNAIDASTARFRWYPKERRMEYLWKTADGALRFNIYKLKDDVTGETDADMELVDTVLSPGVSWSGPVKKNSLNDRTIWVESEGLCGKKSSRVKLVATLPQLPAPTIFQLVKRMNQNGRIKILVSAPPQAPEFIDRTVSLRFFARRSTDGSDYILRSDFVNGQDHTTIFTEPIHSPDEHAHYTFWFEDFEEGGEVWIACCWVDQFDDEGVFKPGFDAMHPPFEVGSANPLTFFRSPDPAHPETNQANGGVYIDDDDETSKIDYSGVYRIPFGIHTQRFKAVFERSSATHDDTYGTWPTDESARVHSPEIDLTDDDLVNGYYDFLMYRDFKEARKKHWAWRLCRVVFIGITGHAITLPSGEDSFRHDRRFLEGFAGDPTGQPIVPYVTDGYFNKQLFQFKPWLAKVDHGYLKVPNCRANQKPAKIKERWDAVDEASAWRYVVFISSTNFGTKGPGTDAAMATALDNLLKPIADGGGGGEGQITLWNQANTIKNVIAYAINVNLVTEFDWEIGTAYGPFTLNSSTTYYVGVIAQSKSGRYSDQLSDTDSDTAGSAAGGGNAGIPTGLTAPNIRRLKSAALVINIVPPSANYHDLPYSNIYIANGSHATATKWLSAADLTSQVIVEASGAIRENPTGSVAVAVSRATLEAIFGVGADIFAYATWANEFGPSDFSPVSVAYNLNSGEAPSVSTDTDRPSGLSTPVLNPQKPGALAKKMFATTNDAEEQYKEVAFFVVDNAFTVIGWVDTVNRASVATEAAALINIGTSGHHPMNMRADELIALFGGPANRNLTSRFYVTNKKGTSDPSPAAALLSFASLLADPIEKDTAITAAPAAPTITVTQKGIRMLQAAPAANFNKLVQCDTVARVKNAGGGIIGYIVNNEPPTNSATEFKNNGGNNLKETFLWRKDVITALYPLGVTIEFYNYVTNGFGISLAGAAQAFNIAAWAAEALQPDTGGPGNGAPIVVTQAKIKNGRMFVATYTLPTLQMNTHSRDTLIIHDNNSTGSGRKYFDTVAGTWGSSLVEKDFSHSTPVSSAEVFVGGRVTVYAVIGVWNAFGPNGTPTYSGDTANPVPLNGTAPEPIDSDTAVPDPSALIPLFLQSGKFLKIENPLPTAQMNSFSKVEVAIFATTSGGTIIGFLKRDGTTGAYSSNGATEFLFDIAQAREFIFNLKKADLPNLFPGIIYLKTYFYVSNARGRSTAHSQTQAITYDQIQDYLSLRGAVNLIEVGETMFAKDNLLRNGDCDKNHLTQTTRVKAWNRWDGNSTLISANVSTFGSGSTGVIWSPTQCNVAIIDGTWFLVQNISKPLKPGEYYTFQADVRAAIDGFAPEIRAWIVKDGVVGSRVDLNGNNLLDNAFIMPTTTFNGGLSSTVYKMIGGSERCQLAANLGAGGVAVDLWLVIGVPVGFAGGHQLILDRIKIAQGRQQSAYTEYPGDTIGVVDTGGAAGIIPGNVGTFPDTNYQPSAGAGGFGSGQGGGFA